MHSASSVMNTEPVNHPARNRGVDLLRMVAMFFIVILHSLGHGGVLNAATAGTAQYKWAWFLEIWAYCAVDIFALVSGYVFALDKKPRRQMENYVVLWLQVVFYSVLIALLCKLIRPDLVTSGDLLKAFFPVSKRIYWYFTAYTGMVCLVPLICAGIRSLTESQAGKLLIVLIAVFSFADIINKQFVLNNGYAVIWLTIVFIIGALIKKCRAGQSLKPAYLVIGILTLNVATWLWRIYGFSIENALVTVDESLLVSYCSPTVLLSAILYLILFSKLTFRGGLLKKTVACLAPGTFAVYLINDNPCFRRCFIKDSFAGLAQGSPAVMVLKTAAFSLLFVAGALLIDKARQKLFSALRIRYLAEKTVGIFDSFLERMIKSPKP